MTGRSLHEKAASIADARKRGLALYIGHSRYGKTYMLYDADKLLDYVSDPKFIENPFVTNLGLKLAKICAMASIETSPKTLGKKWNASEIVTSAAQEGYGPLLYDIVMELENGLMADRSNVSPSAKKVWAYYLNNRKDVEPKELDDIENPKTKTKKDDSQVFDGGTKNPLNYAYFIKKGPAVTTLLNNHSATVEQLKKLKIKTYVKFDLIAGELFIWKFYI